MIVLKGTEFNSEFHGWKSYSGLSQCLSNCKAGLKISFELGEGLARNHNVKYTSDDINPSRGWNRVLFWHVGYLHVPMSA